MFNNASVRYTDNISRLDFAILAAEVFCKAKGVEIDEYIDQNNISLDFDKFTDTENAHVLLANKLGILNGTSETEFSPARGITRQEAAVMINNLAGLLGLSPNSDRQYFSDSSYFADWESEAICNVSNIRNSEGTALMTGTEENKFSPWMVYSREQAYVTLWRLYETAADK
ncbi:MAG: S-layer homology domain-containing protein [Clostridiales bacterium]|nr:S-layer homology domain-containing protein [Clostridiales bacterium]